jgi:hypothetical protein
MRLARSRRLVRPASAPPLITTIKFSMGWSGAELSPLFSCLKRRVQSTARLLITTMKLSMARHCEEPTDPREARPDDRLRDEAIHAQSDRTPWVASAHSPSKTGANALMGPRNDGGGGGENSPARFSDASRVYPACAKKIPGKPGVGAHFLSFHFPTIVIWRFVSSQNAA